MRALQWDGHSLQLNDVAIPERDTSSALIKISKAGICNTDLEILKGYYPFSGTLGHEFIGVISDAEDHNLIGKRVVSDINISCHKCSMCLAQHPHHCLQRLTLGINKHDGAFAEFITAPISNLVMVPDNLSDDAAVFAEPVAAALEILEQVDFSHINEVAVIGDGKLGLLISQCLASSGLQVNLIGHHADKLALVAGPNISTSLTPPEQKFAVVVEATGNPKGFDTAIKLTRARGTLVLKSTYAGSFNFNPAPLVVNEITLIGSRCGPMQKAINLLASGTITPTNMISHSFDLLDGIDAIKQAQQKGALKILLNLNP